MYNLYDGAKIYDTPKYRKDGKLTQGTIAGYNHGFNANEPTYAVGSTEAHCKFWERVLFNETLSVFDFTIPPEWDKDFILWVLFRNGFFAILKDAKITTKDGTMKMNIPQPCTLAGRNVYYQPTRAVVANRLIERKEWVIDKNCSVIKLSPDWCGMWDIIHFYAELLAMETQSLRMAIGNSRGANGFAVDGKAQKETVTAFLDRIDQGQSNIIVLSDMKKDADGRPVAPWVEFRNDVGANYIIDKLQKDIETTMNEFRRRIGIPILSDKKERENIKEVSTIIGNAMSEIDVYYDCLKRSIERAKIVFPDLTFDVKLPKNGGDENAV